MSEPGAVASADVVVVGGGIIGAACAYELSRVGVSVVLCEQRTLAFGASGRNPGFVWMHTRQPGVQLQLSWRTRARYATLAEELDWDFELRPNGGLIFFHTPEQRAVMQEFVSARRDVGLDVQLLDGDEARDIAPILPADVLGASFCTEDAQISTAKLVEGLAAAAQRQGARVLLGTEVRSISMREGRTVGVETSAGRIDAGHVVLAAGVWTPFLAERLGVRLPIEPMRLQLVATAPQAPVLEHLLYGPAAIRQYDLFRQLPSFRADLFAADEELDQGLPFLELACQTKDGRFLLGCPMDFVGHVWEPDLAGVATIASRLQAALPALRGARFERAWAGLLPRRRTACP